MDLVGPCIYRVQGSIMSDKLLRGCNILSNTNLLAIKDGGYAWLRRPR
jgi:hypothetical protein